MQTKISAFLWGFVKKFRWQFVKFYSMMIVEDLAIMLVSSYVLKIITDKANNNSFDNLILYGLLYCFLLTYSYLSRFFRKSIEYTVRKKLDRKYVLKFFKTTLDHEISFFANNLTGQLTSKIFNIQSKLEYIFGYGIGVISNAITTFAGFFVFYFIDYKITIFGIVWFLIYLPIIVCLFKRNFAVSDKNSENITKSTGIINDCFINIMNIKMFSNEKREYRQIKRQSLNILRSQSQILKSKNILNLFNYFMGGILAFGIFSIVFVSYLNGKTPIGSLLFVSGFALTVIFWINFAIRTSFDIVSAIATINNSIDVLTQEVKIKDKKDAKPLELKGGRISFKNIKFSYDD